MKLKAFLNKYLPDLPEHIRQPFNNDCIQLLIDHDVPIESIKKNMGAHPITNIKPSTVLGCLDALASLSKRENGFVSHTQFDDLVPPKRWEDVKTAMESHLPPWERVDDGFYFTGWSTDGGN